MSRNWEQSQSTEDGNFGTDDGKPIRKGDVVMVKLNKHVNALEDVQQKIEEKIDSIQDKIDSIEDKALDEDRDVTQAEQNRIEKLEEEIESLQDEKVGVVNE